MSGKAVCAMEGFSKHFGRDGNIVGEKSPYHKLLVRMYHFGVTCAMASLEKSRKSLDTKDQPSSFHA